MALYEKWLEIAQAAKTAEEDNKFWSAYFLKEQKNYEIILESKNTQLKGTIKELAEKFSMDSVTFIGFMDGINTSLKEEISLEELDEDSEINVEIDLEKLYHNMLDAKADWLYNLSQWEDILTAEKRKEIKKAYNESKIVRNENKIGRNDPCPCGSGKKYKQCCLNK